MSHEYTVRLSRLAASDIQAQGVYIAQVRQEPMNAKRWLERIWDAVAGLRSLPRRAPVARFRKHLPYEVRNVVVGSHLVLFTIDDETRTVYVLRVWPAKRLPRDEDLPASVAEIEE